VSGSSDRPLIAVITLAAAVLIVAVLAIAGVFSGGEDGGEPAAQDFGETTTAATPTAPAAEPTVTRIPVAGSPDAISAGAGFIWVSDSLGGTLKRLDPESGQPTGIPVAGFPTDVGAGEGGVFVTLPDRGAVQRITGARAEAPVRVQGFPFQIAAGEDAAWAMSQDTVERIDASSGRPDGEPISLDGPGSSIAAGEGSVWVTRANREVVRISPEGGEISGSPAAAPGAFSVAVGDSAVWALGADGPKGSLTRIDPGSGETVGKPIAVPGGLDVAAGLGFVWITEQAGTVTRIDPGTGSRVGKPIGVGRQPQSISVGEGAVWVACASDGAVYRITP
jgi:streptogramin lyase